MVKIKHKYKSGAPAFSTFNTTYASYRITIHGIEYGNYVTILGNSNKFTILRELVHSKHRVISQNLGIPLDLLKHLKG